MLLPRSSGAAPARAGAELLACLLQPLAEPSVFVGLGGWGGLRARAGSVGLVMLQQPV